MKLTPIAIILFVAVLGQGALVAYWARTRPESLVSTIPTATEPRINAPAAPVGTTPSQPVTPSKAHFDWSQIENTDFEQYIANLRALNCPEQTIRDIIIADVNKLYAPREAPFLAAKVKSKALLPWEAQVASGTPAAPADSKADFERRRQLREIEREKAAVVKQLLGIDLPLSPLQGWRPRNYDRIEAALAAMPAEKRERVREIQEVYWQASDTLNDQYKDRGPVFTAESQRIKEERRNMMAQILSPEELDDFEMRASNVAQQLSGQLAGLKPSEQEFRAIYSARRELDEPSGGTSPDLTPEQRGQREEAARNQIKEALGEERFSQYERSLDSSWQQLGKLQNRFGLEPEKVEEAYQLIGDWRKETADALTAVGFGTPGQPASPTQTAELQARWQQAFDRLSSVLGEKASQVMQARAEGFLPNIANKNVPNAGRTGLQLQKIPAPQP